MSLKSVNHAFRKTSIIWIAILSVGIVSSCGPCRNADAAVSIYELRFQLIDKTTGDNLLFGPNSTLNLDDLKLYSLVGKDTLFYPMIPREGFASQNQDDQVFTEIFPPASDVFLEYPDKTRDSLFVTFSQRESECWGLLTYITSVTRNQLEFFENNREPLIFLR